MNHYDLCKKTAERFIKDNNIVLYEYQSIVSGEQPDVLCFKYSTTLFEIKMSKPDFLADAKKDCRIKYKLKHYKGWDNESKKPKWCSYDLKKRYNEKPHLGAKRYYVCLPGIIEVKDLPEGWGLYWYKNNKFYKKRESSQFVRNIHSEMNILSHAFRKYANTDKSNILVSKFIF